MSLDVLNLVMNIKRYISLLIFCLMCSLSSFAQSTMTDQQVLDYVKQSLSAGKTQETIASELAARGVNRAQAQRVRKLFEKEGLGSIGSKKNAAQDTLSRAHSVNEVSRQKSAEEMDRMHSILDDTDIIDKQAATMESDQVYGRDLFQNKNLNFAPSENLATPRNYRLGPGDEVIIDIFGANQTTMRSTISPEGSINVDVLGPLYLNGMTIEEANKFLKRKLASIYAGLNRNDAGTDIRLSLGQIRSIQINVLGDVTHPGTYSVSSFATVFHALYLAGGIKDPGTLRNIRVSRNGKTVAMVDVYDFLMNGNRQSDIRLEEGDVILVSPYEAMVKVSGLVKRPMNFEIKSGETLYQVIQYAGGFAKSAYTNNITVIRQTGKDYEVCTVDEMDFKVFEMKDGDEVMVDEIVSRFENRVSIKGAVYRAGIFQLDSKTNTVKSLIERAEGLMPEAFTSHAVLSREREDRTMEVLSVDVDAILKGTTPDVPLRNNDELYIPSYFDLKDQGTLTISGEIARPGVFPYAENMTLEDLIIRAGGMLESASTARVDVSRRIKDARALTAKKEIAELYSFEIKDNYVISGQVGFLLQPYDEVIVRKSPSYNAQEMVTIKGEANFTGRYPLTMKGERLTQLLEKAGGATEFAYLKGARLLRKVNETELARMKAALKSHVSAEDSLVADTLTLNTQYMVGIDLDKAVSDPGSIYDVVLREGDELVIPQYSNTVRIDGAVLNPNEVTFESSRRVKYYVDQAGGYSNIAKKRKAYMISMNGHITKARKRTKVEPGAEIIVPQKEKRPGSLQSILGVATTAASLGTMAASIANILK